MIAVDSNLQVKASALPTPTLAHSRRGPRTCVPARRSPIAGCSEYRGVRSESLSGTPHRLSPTLSAFRERPVDSIEEVRVGQVQVPRGRRDVRVADEALHDVDVLSGAHEARRAGVTPAVWVVPTGHARARSQPPRPGCAVPEPRSGREAPVAPQIGEQVRRRRELGSQLAEVFAEHVRENVGYGDNPRLYDPFQRARSDERQDRPRLCEG